jgi:hypothetical protein
MVGDVKVIRGSPVLENLGHLARHEPGVGILRKAGLNGLDVKNI